MVGSAVGAVPLFLATAIYLYHPEVTFPATGFRFAGPGARPTVATQQIATVGGLDQGGEAIVARPAIRAIPIA